MIASASEPSSACPAEVALDDPRLRAWRAFLFAQAAVLRELETEITAALRRTGLPAELDPLLTDDVLDRVKVDKKRIGDKVRFIAVREVGACDPVEITVTELRRILRPDPTA